MFAILDIGTERFSNFKSPFHSGSIRLTVGEEIWFDEFQDGRHGGHLGNLNGTILAILNLFVAPMPSTKFQLCPTYLSEAVNS